MLSTAVERLEAALAPARARRDAALDPTIKMLRPTPLEWMTEEEMEAYDRALADVQLEARDEVFAARVRVAQKRELRRAGIPIP